MRLDMLRERWRLKQALSIVERLDADHESRSPKRQQQDIEWVLDILRNAAVEMQAACGNACLKVREEYTAKIPPGRVPVTPAERAALDCHDRISRMRI